MRKRPAPFDFIVVNFLACVLVLGIFPKMSFAVVGQAEKFNEFEEEKLQEFHESLYQEELRGQMETKQMKKMAQPAAQGPKSKPSEVEDLEKLKMELLTIPKRKRIQVEAFGTYKYTSNPSRAQLDRSKGDSIFDQRGSLVVDLSGKKTDFRLITDAGKLWNIEQVKNDMFEVHQSLNYRRKYFKKVHHSVQYKVGRQNTKTPEINGSKTRWDLGMNNTYNYPMFSKLSMNTTFTTNRRIFPDVAFHKDSSWEATAAPSLFWNFTPKSRISLGYNMGVNSILSKKGNTNSHEVHFGYFGRVTRKSSTSFDLSCGLQVPRSAESPSSKTLTAGIGYIWQWTAKTQLTFQLMRSLQNTSSDLVSGDINGANVTSKQDVHYTNDSFSLSINSRLTRRLDARLNWSITHFHNKTSNTGSFSSVEGGLKDLETDQITLPLEIMLTYHLHRFATLNLGYTFAYRRADEKPDEYRVHELNTSMRLTY